MKKIWTKNNLYLPAVSIIVVVIVLLVLIGVSTSRNLSRDREKALYYLEQHGRTLLMALEISTQSGIDMDIWSKDAIDHLIRAFGEDEEIAYIYVASSAKHIMHCSHDIIVDPWLPDFSSRSEVKSRLYTDDNGKETFELSKIYAPLPTPSHNSMSMGQNINKRPHNHYGDTIVIGLEMAQFEAARLGDRQHAMFMGGILLVLGSGVIFFLFVIQNYFLINRSLQASKDYTRKVVDSMANGLLSIDSAGSVITQNANAAEILGVDPEVLAASNLSTFLDFKACGIKNALEDRQVVMDSEIQYARPTKEDIVIGLSIAPLETMSHKPTGAVLILRDLTEFRALEDKVKRSEKLASIGALAANIAHEVRNPLSSIRGFAGYLDHSLADKPDLKEYTQVMVKEIDRINEVVTDLLSFAQQRQIKKSNVILSDLIQHVVTLIEIESKNRRIKIHTSTGPDLIVVPADEAQLTQLLLNLLLNALQALGSGGLVQIGAVTDVELGKARLWVEDNGPGIDAGLLGRIFDPFYTTRKGGSGLGLSIVQQIVDHHGGQIKAYSPPPGKNSGSRFELCLPIDKEKCPS